MLEFKFNEVRQEERTILANTFKDITITFEEQAFNALVDFIVAYGKVSSVDGSLAHKLSYGSIQLSLLNKVASVMIDARIDLKDVAKPSINVTHNELYYIMEMLSNIDVLDGDSTWASSHETLPAITMAITKEVFRLSFSKIIDTPETTTENTINNL